jgi:hypothetical protein
MAAAARKKKRKNKAIVFVLTPKQKKALQGQGLLRNQASAWLRVRYRNGKVVVSRHTQKRRPVNFVASNAAFA